MNRCAALTRRMRGAIRSAASGGDGRRGRLFGDEIRPARDESMRLEGWDGNVRKHRGCLGEVSVGLAALAGAQLGLAAMIEAFVGPGIGRGGLRMCVMRGRVM